MDNGAIPEMYCKLELWYSALVISGALTCTNYRVVFFFTDSHHTYLRGANKRIVKLREM
jgi:hypothetical protein